jgi:hypothetical protein
MQNCLAALEISLTLLLLSQALLCVGQVSFEDFLLKFAHLLLIN